ncbi:MAG: serine/threonine protein kinase [Micromonosporaceae bacterium]|nr:serine/threonine protein kinase [Micromonosporaceae bacterium]
MRVAPASILADRRDGKKAVTTQPSTWQGESSFPPAPNERAVPGTLVGSRYQLRAAIGHGGMGTVWQAQDTLLNRDVAVKEVLLPPGIAPEERTALYERTMREARAAAALSHPSVVQVYDVVIDGDRPWIIMELLHARSLADMIISDGPLAPRAVAKIGVALLGALEVAHEAGVLHRDVKPANILICTDGRCVLTDFGVARLPSESNLTTPGMVLGSPHFISPERAVGGKFGPPSDLFSLGVSLYTAIEGRPPFDRGDPFETMRAVVEEPPAQAVRAGELAPVLYGLLEKDPLRRWDVRRARQDLRDLLAGPLANQSTHHVTDPYSVVPVAPVAPPPMPYAPTGQVGGRALLPPDAGYPLGSPVLEPTNPRLAPYRRGRHGAPRDGVLAGMGPGARDLAGRVRRWPRVLQLSLAGGAVVALVVLIGAAAGWFSGGRPATAGHPVGAPSPTNTPLIPNVQIYHDTQRGFSLNVPANWQQRKAASYVDFVDPQDPSGRKLRVNVENAGDSATKFLISAENQLKSKTSICTAPYKRIALRDDVLLDRRPAAELEYTCGTGDQTRHGLWMATVINKKAYEFFLTVEDDKFVESKPIYLEAARSYQLAVS